jgi:hypothetical protein
MSHIVLISVIRLCGVAARSLLQGLQPSRPGVSRPVLHADTDAVAERVI